MLLPLRRLSRTNFRCFCSTLKSKLRASKEEHYLARSIAQKIKSTGPITISEYMKEVLTNPISGYYMNKDMFGDKGDFITSPEISQMFGEMLAVWFLNEWQKIGSPKPFQIVELGPGRGTLSADILRVFSHFNCLHNVALNLVEVSPFLSEVQAKSLCAQWTNVAETDEKHYRQGVSRDGINIRWYNQLQDVPKCFTLFVAHEFFDALPIHKFHKSYNGFKEVLIDFDREKTENDQEPKFRYILARDQTPMMNTLLNKDETRGHVEISPDSLLLYQQLSERVGRYGGIALICDYGHNGDGTDTFRAFKKHKQVDPLELPGTADLTADVDFNSIREVM